MFLSSEALFRLYYFGPDALLSPWNYSPESILRTGLVKSVPDPAVGWRMRENASGYLKGARLSTNEYGMRGPSITIDKPPGTIRLAVLGRSISLGTGVDDDEVYTSRLQRLLDRFQPGRYQVLNFSVGGYDTSQALDSYEQYVAPFDVDMILIPQTVGTILSKTNIRPRRIPKAPLWTNLRWHLRHFFIYRAALATWLRYMSRTSYYSWSGRQRGASRQGPNWVRTADLIREFAHRRCAEGVPVVVVLWHAAGWHADEDTERVREALENAVGTSILDTREVIDGNYIAKNAIYYGENHPDAAQHERYAKAIFKWFTNRRASPVSQSACRTHRQPRRRAALREE